MARMCKCRGTCEQVPDQDVLCMADEYPGSPGSPSKPTKQPTMAGASGMPCSNAAPGDVQGYEGLLADASRTLVEQQQNRC
jgi:hypothetical protein